MELIAFGCSAGGLSAMQTLMRALAPHPGTAFVTVMHSTASSVEPLCDLLALHASMPVVLAQERTPVIAGAMHLAPAGYHLLVGGDRQFYLTVDPKVCFARPSIDVLFESVAEAYGPAAAGVILTGANDDGARGLQSIRRQGGLALVQDPAEAQATAMPRAALDLAGADYCLPLAGLAATLNRICP